MQTLTSAQARGRVIAAARVLLGWDQSELASRAGVSNSTVSNIESGKVDTRNKTYIQIKKALRSAGVDWQNGFIRNKVISLTFPFCKTADEDEED